MKRGASGSVSVGAKARRNANQTILTGPTTPIIWQGVEYDDGALWSAVNPTRLTAPVNGKYHCTFQVLWDGSTGGVNLAARIRKNGVTEFAEDNFIPVPPNAFVDVTRLVVGEVELAAGEYIDAIVIQVSGGDAIFKAGNSYGSFLTMRKVG
jgi:hypothetical protein